MQSGSAYLKEKDVSLSVDITQKNGWESQLTTYVDNIPFHHIGKGKQNIIKIMLALHASGTHCSVVLIEEPENHQSFANLQKLMSYIAQECIGKQIILCTHSPYILNKLGLQHAILLHRGSSMAQQTTFASLNADTMKYFQKLPGYDTLRFLLSDRCILVEGPTEELLVQRYYFDQHGKLPIEDGIDIMSVRGLSFLRFLELSAPLKKEITIITDNDGDHKTLEDVKYQKYKGDQYVRLCYSKDDSLPSIEHHFLKINKLIEIQKVIGTAHQTEAEVLKFMQRKKTEWALAVFEAKDTVEYPQYIKDAFK